MKSEMKSEKSTSEVDRGECDYDKNTTRFHKGYWKHTVVLHLTTVDYLLLYGLVVYVQHWRSCGRKYTAFTESHRCALLYHRLISMYFDLHWYEIYTVKIDVTCASIDTSNCTLPVITVTGLSHFLVINAFIPVLSGYGLACRYSPGCTYIRQVLYKSPENHFVGVIQCKSPPFLVPVMPLLS